MMHMYNNLISDEQRFEKSNSFRTANIHKQNLAVYKNQNDVFLWNPLEKQSQLGVWWIGHSLICSAMMSSTPLRRLIHIHAIGGSPAFSRHFCIKARKKNCFLDNSRTCCKTKDIFFFFKMQVLHVMHGYFCF